MRRSAMLLAILLFACAPTTRQVVPSTSQPPPSSSISTKPHLSTTSTTVPRDVRSVIRRVDPATLEVVGSEIRLDGHLAPDTVALPDGRLVMFTWVDETWSAVVVDPTSGDLETTPAPFVAGVRPVGYSAGLQRVVVLGYGFDAPTIYLFDPASRSFDKAFGGLTLHWPHRVGLFDGGRKIAVYVTHGYDIGRVGDPPEVWIGDLETDTIGAPIPVAGVAHGHTELAPEMVRNSEFPYGTVEPGIAVDSERDQLYVVHADARGVTSVDLMAQTAEVHRWDDPPSFWSSVMSWLMPPAQAKGAEPSASVSAELSSDGSLLFATGESYDAWRDAEGRLHTSQSALGLLVIDTNDFSLVSSLEIPVSTAVASEHRIAVTGTSGNQIWCDGACTADEPEVTGQSESSGLVLLDSQTLEIRQQREPVSSDGFNLLGHSGQWLFVEIYGEDTWAIESINLSTGVEGGRRVDPVAWFLITGRGVFEVTEGSGK